MLFSFILFLLVLYYEQYVIMYILVQVINDFIEKDYVIIIDGKLIRQDYGGEFGVYDKIVFYKK